MTLRKLVAVLAALLVAAAPAATAGDGDEEDEKNAKDDETTEENESSSDVGEADTEENESSSDVGEADAEVETEDDKDRDEEADFDEAEREVKVEVGDREVTVKYERESGAAEDELKFTYHADEGDIKLSYENETDTTETEDELKIRVLAVIEYADADGDGRYSPGTDRVASSFRVDELDWNVSEADVVTLDGVSGKRFEGRAPLGGNGSLALRFTAMGDFVDINGTTLRPTDLKFDIIVDGYPYAENGTALAMHVETKHESKWEADEDADAAELAATAGDRRFYFTWAENVTVDGVVMAVGSTIVKAEDETKDDETETKRELYLSYPRGDAIVHDPIVGVQSASATERDASGASATPVAGAAVVVGVAALAAVALGRRRRA